MSEIDDVLANLPLSDLASRLGSSPAEVEQAARAALPALLGGLGANAQDPAGADSIAQALGQHSPGLVDGGVNLDEVDATDGEAITSHIFGGQRDEVVSRLGGVSGGDSSLIRKLLPLLAPIVLSYLARQLGGRSGGTASSGAPSGGAVQDILGSILGGMTKGAGGSGGSAGSILTDVLGGVLGGGRR